MPVLLHILFFKLKSFIKLSSELRFVNIIKNIASMIVFGGFTIGAYYFARSATTYLLDTAHLGLFLVHRFISMLLFVFFVSINVGNMIVAYATFYRSVETAYYFTKPISYTQIFLVKFLDVFFYSSTTLFLVAAAVLAGYGSYFKVSLFFYFQTMLLMFIPFMLISACIGVMMLLLLIRFALKYGIRKLVSAVVLLYLGSIFFYFKMTNPLQLTSNVLQKLPHVDEYFGYLDPPVSKYFPNHWISESLYWTMRGSPDQAASYTILLIVFTVCLFAVMVIIAKKLFYKSWLISLELQNSSESSTGFLNFISLLKTPRLDVQTSVLLKKDFFQFVREPSQWIHVGIISLLVFTFIVSISKITMNMTSPFLQTVSYMVVFLFNAFLVSSIALRFVYPMISIEGESFWSVLSAPISRRKIFNIKFLLSFVPLTMVSVLLVIFSHKPLQNYTLLLSVSLSIILMITFALVSLNLGAGAFFADFKEKNPIRAASSQTATLTFLVSMLYLTFVVGVLFFPLQKYFEFMRHRAEFSYSIVYFGVLMVIIISMIVGLASVVSGLRALKRDF